MEREEEKECPSCGLLTMKRYLKRECKEGKCSPKYLWVCFNCGYLIEEDERNGREG